MCRRGLADQSPWLLLCVLACHMLSTHVVQIVKLKAFSKFDNTTEALAAATALVDSKLSKGVGGA